MVKRPRASSKAVKEHHEAYRVLVNALLDGRKSAKNAAAASSPMLKSILDKLDDKDFKTLSAIATHKSKSGCNCPEQV
jgi:hypothetical protein